MDNTTCSVLEDEQPTRQWMEMICAVCDLALAKVWFDLRHERKMERTGAERSRSLLVPVRTVAPERNAPPHL
jgi:hypothetical protein